MNRRTCLLQHFATKCESAVRKSQGFSLIELLVALAIIGILASIAFPQYTNYVQKSRRTDGHLALLEQVQAMERCKSTNYSYTNCSLTKETSPEGYYAITLTTTASGFTITATGQGKQRNDTSCLTMTIDQLGLRTPNPDTTSCWPS